MNRDTAYWTAVEEIFEAVVDLDDASRQALLDARCAARPDLRAEVELLLAADARVEGFIEPVMASVSDDMPAAPPGVGRVIGAFRLVEIIGAGGMGTVYRAERADEAFAHRVAVKILATPVSHLGTARRFRAERQILASLRHPHIVSLLDGGVTPDGHAYLAMEYVEGTTFTVHCRDRALPLGARLELFRTVCSAVHYAHRHAVVHRDLKPANILVTPDGVPKVLDFGIAKLLDDPNVPGATATRVGAGPLTPNYASPEQLRGLPVTTSSDVYALGVLLYELVTGVRPYETEGKPLDEVMRLVVDTDPLRPSATTRHADIILPYEAKRALKGDLDAVVLRAMAKQPEERYGSAEELADDVGRYLSGTPVAAREPSFGYVVRKLAARHKTAFVSIGVSLVLILAALMVAIWQARVATLERRRAEQRFGEVRQLANSLIFEIHDAVAPLPGSTPVRRTIVARALQYLERLAREAQGDPALQLELARAYIQIGNVQGHTGAANLGDREGAIKSFRQAQALVDPLAQAPTPATEVIEQFLEATRRLSETLRGIGGRSDDAIREARKAVASAGAHYRRQPTDVKARNFLASSSFTAALAIGWPESLEHWKTAGAMYEALLADRPDDLGNLRNVALVEKYLGGYYEGSRDWARALIHHERARALDERRLSQDPSHRGRQFDVAIDLANVANARWQQGDPASAAPMFERSLVLRQALADSDPQDVLAQSRVAFLRRKLANLYSDLGEFPRALEHLRAAVRIHESQRFDSGSKWEFAAALGGLGNLQNRVRRRVEACAAYGRSFDLLGSMSPGDRARPNGTYGDPLDTLAPQAAACGHSGAQTWLAERARQARKP